VGVITPGKDAFHTDELFLPGLPEAVAADPRFEMPLLIITALTYLTDVDRALCPTYVVPESFRSGRRPAAGETSWRGNAPLVVLAKAGDSLLFRSDVWHSGGTNHSADRTRLLCGPFAMVTTRLSALVSGFRVGSVSCIQR
jgi:ectoine hydroxylase-related dioxygenase (phytanoyl-CoA dioxygenase family)